jgi:hypothetical protein
VTPANAADNEHAPLLLDELSPEARSVPGDTHYNEPALRERCAASDRCVVTTLRGPYPHTDDGGEVRRVFHTLRSLAIDNFNGQFKASSSSPARCRRRAWGGPGTGPWRPSSSSNSPCSTASGTAAIFALASKPANRARTTSVTRPQLVRIGWGSR